MKSITKTLHSIRPDELTGSISTPIYQTATFVQDFPGGHKGYDYARSNNPTRKVLEDLVAELEYGHAGFAFASGLAAIDAVLKLLSAGDEILAVDDIYGGSFRIFTHIYEKLGIKVQYTDTTDIENLEAAITPQTKLIWIETPTNPTLKITDLKKAGELASKTGAFLVVDNTFASPVLQNPIRYGAHIVIHSATKYLAGHSDLIAGVVVTANEELSQRIKFIQNSSGGILGPFDSWLVIRGIETLHLRVERQCHNAERLALFLQENEFVEEVFYPGLIAHKNHQIASRQQKLFGGVISFSLKENTEEAACRLSTSTKLFKLAESLGGVKSLICHPATMTHKSVPESKRLAAGIQPSLIRISAGIEDIEDLTEDLAQAIEIASGKEVLLEDIG